MVRAWQVRLLPRWRHLVVLWRRGNPGRLRDYLVRRALSAGVLVELVQAQSWSVRGGSWSWRAYPRSRIRRTSPVVPASTLHALDRGDDAPPVGPERCREPRLRVSRHAEIFSPDCSDLFRSGRNWPDLRVFGFLSVVLSRAAPVSLSPRTDPDRDRRRLVVKLTAHHISDTAWTIHRLGCAGGVSQRSRLDFLQRHCHRPDHAESSYATVFEDSTR